MRGRSSPRTETVDTGLSGDSDGRFEQAYAQHYSSVLAYCRRRTAWEEAPDAAADTFAVAWRRRDELPAGDALVPWLYGVAYRVLLHQWRAAGRRRGLLQRLQSLSVDQVTGPEGIVVGLAEIELVRRAAQRLQPLDREILRLALWESLGSDAIATALAMTPAAVRQRTARAKRKLAAEFRAMGGVLPGEDDWRGGER
jgi:RNA polymerase sigma-70 factor (ECF subfamily)